MIKIKLNVGVIGLGVGESHIPGYLFDDRCNLLALSDFDEDKLVQVGIKYPQASLYPNPDDVIRNPIIDVITIASYDNYHAQQVTEAINRGKHVFVEKPLCLYRDEFYRIKSALELNPKICLSSNLILRKAPRFIELKRRIANGDLGEVYYIEGDYDYGRLHKLTNGWRGEIPYYSVTHGGAIHLIDLILWLLGPSSGEAFAFASRTATQDSIFKHNDLVTSLLRFDSGLLAKLSANFGSVTPHGHKLAVYGTKGTFIHGHHGAHYYKSRDKNSSPENVEDPYPGALKGDMIPSFISAILDGTPPLVSKEEVLQAMDISLSIEESVKLGKPVLFGL